MRAVTSASWYDACLVHTWSPHRKRGEHIAGLMTYSPTFPTYKSTQSRCHDFVTEKSCNDRERNLHDSRYSEHIDSTRSQWVHISPRSARTTCKFLWAVKQVKWSFVNSVMRHTPFSVESLPTHSCHSNFGEFSVHLISISIPPSSPPPSHSTFDLDLRFAVVRGEIYERFLICFDISHGITVDSKI